MNTKLWSWTKNIVVGNKGNLKIQWQFAKRFASIGASFLSAHLVSLLWSLK